MREKIYCLYEALGMVCVLMTLMAASLACLCLCVKMALWFWSAL